VIFGPGETRAFSFFGEVRAVERAVFAGVVAVGAAAAAFDLRAGRVPNWVVLVGALGGLALQAVMGGWRGLMKAALGALAGFGLLFLPAARGWVGGGDCKLLAALGALLGPRDVLLAFLYGSAAGGIGAVLALGSGRLRDLIAALIVAAGGGKPALPAAGKKVPYAPFLALGGVLAAAGRWW